MVAICITAFISLYVLNFLIDMILDHLNISHMQKYREAPPEVFKERVPLEKHQQSIAYSLRYSKFSKITSTFSAIVFLAFVYTGLMNYLDTFLFGYISNEIYRGLAFFIILNICSYIIGIPFDLYSTFVIEEEFGFNKQTLSIWVVDQIKQLFLSLVIMLPLGFLVLYFMKSAGNLWWLYVWGAIFLFGLTLSKLYPVLIAPMFNTFTPLEQGELRDRIEELAKRVDFPLENVYTMDATKRTEHANAYFAGFGKTKRLVLFDTLTKNFSTNEIVAVVAHEIGHSKKKHIIQGMFFSQITSLLFFFLLSIAIGNQYLYKTFLIENQSIYMGLLLLSLVCSTALSMFAPLFNMLSWKFEYEADRYAYDHVEPKEAIVSLFAKLAEKNLSNLTPHPAYARFNYSHPPVLMRLKALGLDKS